MKRLALTSFSLLALCFLAAWGPGPSDLAPTPTPPASSAGLPLNFWANLPLYVCGVFVLAGLIGSFFIIRLRRRLARERTAHDT